MALTKQFFLPKRVVTLGSKGFLAAKFVERVRSEEVDILALGSAEVDLTKPESVDFLRGRIQDEDTVVMFSALTPDKGRDLKTYEANMKMAMHFSSVIEKTPPAHLMYISSDAVYPSTGSTMTEASACDATDLYALMHLGREKILGFAMQNLKRPYTILRPCAVYGIGDTHQGYGPNRFVRSALESGKIPLFGVGAEIRDHVWIEDVIEWIWLSALKRSDGIINLVSGRGLSFEEVAKIISENCGSSIEIATSEQKSPVFHREFDDRGTREAFPERMSTPFETAIVQMIQQQKEKK